MKKINRLKVQSWLTTWQMALAANLTRWLARLAQTGDWRVVRFGLGSILFGLVVLSALPQIRVRPISVRAAQTSATPATNQAELDKWPVMKTEEEVAALPQIRSFEASEVFDGSRPFAALQQTGRPIAQRSALNNANWTAIGPFSILNGETQGVTNPVSGRATAIVVDPADANGNTFYVGLANGGVWRTTDGGTNWTPLLDDAQSLAIGALTLDPANPTTLWVGTGESNIGTFNFAGVGLYRVLNAKTAPVLEGPFDTRTGGPTPLAFRNTSITQIVVDPADPNRMWVGNTFGRAGKGGDILTTGGTNPPTAFVGLYHSTNAQSANPTFIRVPSLPGNGAAAVTDIALEPGNPNNLVVGQMDFAAGAPNSGIWRSTNATLGGSSTWTRVHNLASQQVDVRVTYHKAGAATTVYAATAETAPGCDGQNRQGVLRRSNDGGASFSAPIAAVGGFCEPHCNYSLAVVVNPNNPNNVYLGGSQLGTCSRNLAKTTDGVTFPLIGNGSFGFTQGIAIQNVGPGNPDVQVVYVADGGGIFKSTDGGQNFTSLNNGQLSATQVWSIADHSLDPDFILIGTGDTGTVAKFGSTEPWKRVNSGAGWYTLATGNWPNNVTTYNTFTNRAGPGAKLGFFRANSRNCAENAPWVFRGFGFTDPTLGCDGVPLGANNGIGNDSAVHFSGPMALGPGNPNTHYFGTDRLYRSTDQGDTMTVVSQQFTAGVPISAIEVAPSNDNVRLVGLNNGGLFFTATGANPMTNADPSNTIPNVYIPDLKIDPITGNLNIAYVDLGRSGLPAGQHIWKTTNLLSGAPTWTPSGTGIPDIPVNALVIDPTNSNKLYAGTDIGVFNSVNGGANWTLFSDGMPRVPVFDLAFQYQASPSAPQILRAATFGRGIYETQTNCTLTSPSNITTTTAPGQCGITVNYPPPTTSGKCGTVTCTPPSGSFFPVSVTTVNCSGSEGGGTASFTVTVNDNQAPALTCPSNVSATSATPTQVNYPAPTVSDNCPNIGAPICTPPSGSAFPVGTTTVNCSVSDAANNQVNCSFTITVTNAGAGLQFYPLPAPVRLLDTRPGELGCDTPNAPITGGTSRTQTAAGRTCNGITIPPAARALTGNITTVQSGGGYLTLYPSDATQPLVANSNYNLNEILNNVFTVGLGSDGAFKTFVTSTTHVVIDVTGYYAPPSAGGLFFHPLPKPIRLLETRAGFTGCNMPGMPLPGDVDTAQPARLTCDGVTIPNTAQAIVGNATTVNPGGGYLTLFPANAARPLVASSNYLPGQVMNAPFTVGLSPSGQFKIYPTTQTDLVIDVLGYYSAEATDQNGAGLLFNSLARPVRLLETRNNPNFPGCFKPNAPIQGGVERTQPARGVCDGVLIANTTLAIVGNATVVNSNGGYLTFWPSNAVRPLVATSNFAPGQIFNRHFTVGLGNTDGAFKLFAPLTTDLVIDVSGYFAP